MRRQFMIVTSTVAAAALLAGCGSSGKPSREEVQPGLVKVLMENRAKPTQAEAEAIADCMLDRTYDSVHVKTLTAWAEGSDRDDEVSDNVLVFEASRDCSKPVKEARSSEASRAASAAAGPMPSRAQIRTGLATSLMNQPARPTRAQAETIADCMLRELGKSVSETTLRSWAKSSRAVAAADATKVNASIRSCGESVLG